MTRPLADLFGVASRTVNAIVGNEYSPPEVAFRIARAFGAPLGTVIQYREG